jgi:hypothetical protein
MAAFLTIIRSVRTEADAMFSGSSISFKTVALLLLVSPQARCTSCLSLATNALQAA